MIGLGDVTAIVGLFLRGVELVAKTRQDSGKGRPDGVREAQELALRLWGSILFEAKDNIQRVRAYVLFTKEDRPKAPHGGFNFDVSNALMTDFCRLAPTPQILEECRQMNSELKQVQHYLLLTQAPRPPRDSKSSPFDDWKPIWRASRFADHVVEGALIQRFNTLLGIAQQAGEAIFGDAWAGGQGMLPTPIDPSEKPPPESW